MTNRGDVAVMIACGLALLTVMTAGRAQGLADPTRPPATVEKPAALPAAGETEAATTGLNTIIRRVGEKPAAIINGEYVPLGGRVGDAKVIKINDDSVVLKSAAGQETLRLNPSVDKTPAAKSGQDGSNKTAGEKVRK